DDFSDSIFVYGTPPEMPAGANRRFRGFQAVESTLPKIGTELAGSVVFERFTYRHDPDGALDYKSFKQWTIVNVGYQKLTVDRNSYASENYLGGVKFVHPVSSSHTECRLDGSVDCDLQHEFTKTTSYDYEGFTPPGTWTSSTQAPQGVVLWALGTTT